MDLVDKIYEVTCEFPKGEVWGLRSQIRRAAVSIPSNIAEGSQRNSKKEFIRFLSIAYASLAELETQMEIAYRQKYILQKTLSELFAFTGEIGKMLNGLSASIDKKLSADCELLTANYKPLTVQEVI